MVATRGASEPSRRGDPPADGRSTRWEEHKEARRAELVRAAVDAIEQYGTSASIAQIAEIAEVSRPILYRYFSDKDELYWAVGRWATDNVLGILVDVTSAEADVHDTIRRICDTYMRFLDDFPQMFRLLTEHRHSDPLSDSRERLAATLTEIMTRILGSLGVSSPGTEAWSHATVGVFVSFGDWWVKRDVMSREDATGYLVSIVTHAFTGFVADNGVGISAEGALELLSNEP